MVHFCSSHWLASKVALLTSCNITCLQHLGVMLYQQDRLLYKHLCS